MTKIGADPSRESAISFEKRAALQARILRGLWTIIKKYERLYLVQSAPELSAVSRYEVFISWISLILKTQKLPAGSAVSANEFAMDVARAVRLYESLQNIVLGRPLSYEVADQYDPRLAEHERLIFVDYTAFPSRKYLEWAFSGGVNLPAEVFLERTFEKIIPCREIDESPQDRIMCLAKIEGKRTSEDVLQAIIKNMDCRPATDKELLAFVEARPRSAASQRIAALGSFVRFGDRSYVLITGPTIKGFEIGLAPASNDFWPADICFLCVRERT